jgi:hypothetical protein
MFLIGKMIHFENLSIKRMALNLVNNMTTIHNRIKMRHLLANQLMLIIQTIYLIMNNSLIMR